MINYCEYCGGLPAGLAPQVYDEVIECVCCQECHEPRPDDERVQAGMRCGACAYGGE